MKKRLFILLVVLFPVMLLAQPMDSTTVFRENFETFPVKVTPSVSVGGDVLGDWRLVGPDTTYLHWHNLPLYKSPYHSYHTPVYSISGNSELVTEPISLQIPDVDVNHIYIDFDHICKVNQLDNATVWYQVAHGYNDLGTPDWGTWKKLTFNTNSAFYHGEARGVSSSTIVGGAMSDKMYSIWSSNNMYAVPNNDTWWRHEMFDLTTFVFTEGDTSTHFRFRFRLNKTSEDNSGTDTCAGWYVDNISVLLSNCEIFPPVITMQAPFFYNTNSSFTNDVGPYNIKAQLYDNDTIATDLVQFSYEINSGPTVILPNTDAFTSNVLNENGHTIQAHWELPSICYQDTIYYHIYLEDTHGSNTRFDTFLVAHHNYTNIHQNDIRIDSLNTMPHCLITNSPQEIEVYFTNRSDAEHSPVTNTMTSGTFTMEVRDESGELFHTSTHNWSGDICFDIPSSLSLGTFAPRHGYNYVTVYVNTRNGQVDGYHANDTILISPYSCDSLLRGDYTVGGTNPDFADITAVREALEFCGLGGPAVFHLRPGTYTDFDFDVNYLGQSAENTITFQGDDVNTVIVTNNHTDAGANIFGAVTLVNVKDYIFKNLTIQGNESATASRGVVVRGNGSTNILFDGCKITAHNTHSTANTSAAVSRTSAVTTGNSNYPDTVIIRNCTLLGGNYGIYYEGGTTKKNFVTIDGCDITSCYRGIYVNYTNGPISNNHIKQVSSTNPQNFTGIYSTNAVGADIRDNTVDSVVKMEYAIYVGNAVNTEDFYVRGNRIHAGNGTAGLYVTANNSANTGTGTCHLYNNEVILYPVTADNSYAMKLDMSVTNNNYGLRIVNNSLLAKSDAPYSTTAALFISNSRADYMPYMYNNILLNQVVCSDRTDYPLYLNGNNTKVSGGYNDFHSGSGVVAYKTVARNTIEELEGITDMSLSNNISYLPSFTNITQSLLPTSFNGLECWRENDVMTDIRGINRSEVTHMGAYGDEIPAIDAALTALVSPVLGECPQPSYDIAVEITNKGAQTINFATNPAVLHLHSAALNLDQDFNLNTGSFTVLTSMNMVLSQNVNMPVNQAVDFLITITTAGDSNHGNDTLSQMFTMEAIFPDYEEDFSNGAQQTWTFQQLDGAGNWTFQEGDGVNPTIIPEYGTGRLFFNSKIFTSGTVSRAILPVVTLTGSVNPILELRFAHDATTGTTSNSKNDEMTVKISTDGGITYTELIPQGETTATIHRYDSRYPSGWRTYKFDLSNYVSYGCVFIAFDAKSKQGNNINIDRIRVRNFYNDDVAVSKIYGAGETPTEYSMRDVVSALVKNEGANPQSDVQVYLNVTGANEQWQDTLTIPSLPYDVETLVTFPDHQYNVQEVKDVEVSVAADQNNNNNVRHWRMVTTQNAATIADTTTRIQLLGDYNTVIYPCVRYKTNEELAVTAVKYYYDQTYIADPENRFRAFVSDAAGNILAKSELVDFSTLQQGAWNTIPLLNFAQTNTTEEFYVGLEMKAHGNYLAAQVETPLRDSTFYYLVGNSYELQKKGRFMIGAVVDTPFVHDVALLELVHPVTSCDLGHEHLKVRIINNGTTDIVPPIQLHYTVNGGAVVTETFTDTLHSHETTLFTFANIYDFTNNLIDYDSNYTIRIWSDKLSQDRLTFNDTLNIVVVSRGKSPLPIVQDTVLVSYRTNTTLTAQLPASIPEGIFGWFTNTGYESWNLLGYSQTYTTPEIYFDTTYYVNANPGTIEDVIVGTGTASGADPFTFNKGYSRGRILYRQQGDIGSYGSITAFALNVKTAAAGSAGIPIKIYMKCTSESEFSSTTVNWRDEIDDATLVVDDRVFIDHTGWFYFNLLTPFDFSHGNLVVYTETNCADFCTGSGNQCNNCGQYVSGSTTYPSFAKTNADNTLCQKWSDNTIADNLGTTYTPVASRPNARFTVANLECGSEKVPIHLHVPDIPTYDVETQELLADFLDNPNGTNQNGCALYNEHIKVQLKNMLNTPIPANKVVVHAVFNGTEITQTVSEAFASEEVKIVEFETPFNFSAPTENITFNYTIYTTLNDEVAVYTGNDTITGSFVSYYTAYMPDSIVYTGNYTNPYEILELDDRSAEINKYWFYANENDATAVHTTTQSNNLTTLYWTTPALYDTVAYWVVGQTKTGTKKCLTKRVKVIINVFSPLYDLSTDELLYPVSYQCANSLNPSLKVTVTNQDTTSTSVIPSGTFNLNAQFTGSNNINDVYLISTPISSLHQDTIVNNGVALGSSTQNRIYQYSIYTSPEDPALPVYTLNDTISGSMYFPALPTAPEALTYNVPYGGTQTVVPGTSALNHYYFYESDDQPIGEGNSFTTEPIYAPTTYYYSGRIESDGFDITKIVGTGTYNSDNTMFNLEKAYSYAKILYNKDDLGNVEGRIDSIYFWVDSAANRGMSIPVKFWLKDTTDVDKIGQQATPNINWQNETASATLVYDGELSFNSDGWIGFAVDGGYDYNGKGLLLYAEQDCGGGCLPPYGLTPIVKFSHTSTGNNKKVYYYVTTNNTPLTGAPKFKSTPAYRINTMFKINYTCESPKAPITINTTVPQHDVGVVAITAPVTQNNSFTNNENVTVTLHNFGTQAASNIPVSYQLDNATPVTQNYSGSLAAGATVEMSFNTACDLTSVYFPTPLRAYTGLSSDAYHPNDTTTILLSVEDPCPSRPKRKFTGVNIANVSIAMLNNSSPGGFYGHYADAVSVNRYTDFTQILAPELLIRGQNYPISVTHAFQQQESQHPRDIIYKKVFIDFNRDGDFEDANELVLSESDISYEPEYATTTGLVDVPSNAELGLTRMRVICSNVPLNNSNSPCGFYDGCGETEDYAIMLSDPLPVDLGIFAIKHPAGEVCADSNATMRIKVRNYGTLTQTFSMDHPVTITATITGAVPGTYTQTVESGTLAPGSDTTVYFRNVNIGANGRYHVHAQLFYEGDQYQVNDTRSIDAKVSTHPLELPYFDPLNASNADLDNPGTALGWTITTDAQFNYYWKEAVKTSHHSGYGPAHDHTCAGTADQDLGGYMSVLGQNNGIGSYPYYQTTALTSRCINMHYNQGYPAELSFYRNFVHRNGDSPTFELRVKVGSGDDDDAYRTIALLTEADGAQTNDVWSEYFMMLDSVDEVAKLRFEVTHQSKRINLCIDDINLILGRPDMAVTRIIDPDTTDCLQVNSTLRPKIMLKNTGHLPVDAFKVRFKTGMSNDTVFSIEHINHHLEPGDSLEYTSNRDFLVYQLTEDWEVTATVMMQDDKNDDNNTKRVKLCTNVSIDDYETENNVYLGQNVPNPATMSTVVPYSVPEPGKVTLEVTNNAGQMIYSAVQEADLGTNYFEVNTTSLAPGLYYYTIYYKDVVLTKKMVVEK